MNARDDPPPALSNMPAARRPRLFARPLLWLTSAFVTGLAVQHLWLSAFSEAWLVICAFALLLITALTQFVAILSRLFVPLSLATFTFLGAAAGQVAAPALPSPPGFESFFNRPHVLFLAEIVSPPDFYPDRMRISLQLHRAFFDGRGVEVQGGVLLTIGKGGATPSAWVFGDHLMVRLTLKPFHNFNNPGGFDYVRSQAEKGLYARAFLEDDSGLVKLTPGSYPLPRSPVGSLMAGLDGFRQEALFWIKGNLEADEADFFGSLLLGYQIPKSWTEHLNRTGTTHLLSISGLHLGLVSLCVFWLACRFLRLVCPSVLMRMSDRHLALWAALFAAAAYALVSGLALATWRSLIMLALFMGATCWYRYSDSLTALAAAALLILVLSPASLRHISFQLSFAAMFGLFIVYPRFQTVQDLLWERAWKREHPLRRVLSPFVEAFWVSLAANITVTPLLVHYFHGISLAGFAANTVLVPVVGFVALPLGLAGIALFALNDQIALPFLETGALVLDFCQDLIVWFSNLSWAYFWVGTVAISWLALYYAGLVVVLGRWQWSRKAIAIALLVLLVSLTPLVWDKAAFRNDSKLFQATAIDVGQSTSTFLRFPNGSTMLVDGGGFLDDSFDIGRFVLAPFLWASGVRRLDFVVLSHDHPDHRNGLRFVLSHFEVGCVWESGIFEPSRGRDEIAEIAARRRIPVLKIPELPTEHAIGSCRVRVLHPTMHYLNSVWDAKDLNNVSLVLQIDYGKTHLILPGDIDREVERVIFEGTTLSGETVLVSPHHGSERSNSALLLDSLRPRALVFSCGFDNLFGFPSPAVLERCAKRNIPTYRTDINGAVHAESDGQKWTITSESDRNINARKESRK